MPSTEQQHYSSSSSSSTTSNEQSRNHKTRTALSIVLVALTLYLLYEQLVTSQLVRRRYRRLLRTLLL